MTTNLRDLRTRRLVGLGRTLFVAGGLALALFGLPVAQADDSNVGADIVQFGYQPAALQVVAGTTVTWTNHDAIIHSVTAGTPGAPSGAFDTDFFDQDQAASVTFNDPGDYTYFCKRHNFMQGTISVTAR